MDITALSTDLSQAKLQTDISFALLENTKELAETQAGALAEMMDAIAIPGLGEHMDISV